MTLRSEIGESAGVARGLLDRAGALDALAAETRDRRPSFAVIAARGTSDHAATYAQYVLGARNALPVALATPSLTTVYDASPAVADALVIGISQSGASPDVVGVVADARRQGAITLAITNDVQSELARSVEHVLDLGAGAERSVAATKTYVAELVAVAMLSRALPPSANRDAGGPDALDGVPQAIERALAAEAEAAAAARGWTDLARCVVLGRGFQYPTAREWSLKLKEIAGVLADPYSAADFEHGPITLVEPGFPVLAVVSSGRGAEAVVPLLRRLVETGADVLVASDDPAIRAIGGRSLALPADVPEWLAPIPAIVPAQLFAYHLAMAKGADPERPRHLQKVTLTR